MKIYTHENTFTFNPFGGVNNYQAITAECTVEIIELLQIGIMHMFTDAYEHIYTNIISNNHSPLKNVRVRYNKLQMIINEICAT